MKLIPVRRPFTWAYAEVHRISEAIIGVTIGKHRPPQFMNLLYQASQAIGTGCMHIAHNDFNKA